MSDAQACGRIAIPIRGCVRSPRQMISLLLIASSGPVRDMWDSIGVQRGSVMVTVTSSVRSQNWHGVTWKPKRSRQSMLEHFVEWTC
jgi:hypothetical protein